MSETPEASAPSDAPATETAATSEPAQTETATATEQPKQDLSKAFLALQKKESAFRAQQEAHKAERAAWDKERASLEASRKEVEAERARYRGLKDNPDPIAALQEAGVDYRELTKRIAESGTPDARIDQVLSELKKRDEQIASLKKEWQDRQEQEKQAREQHEANQLQSQRQQALTQAKQAFAQYVDENWQKYPALSEFDSDDIAEAAVSAADAFAREHGRAPRSPDELAVRLEKVAAEKKAKRDERLAKRKSPTPPAPPAKAEPTAEVDNSEIEQIKKRVAARRPKTINNAAAAETSGQSRNESREQKRARLAALL